MLIFIGQHGRLFEGVQWCWQNVDPPFGPQIWTLFWTPFWTHKLFWRKKNMTVHVKTCINAVQMPMPLFRQETQAITRRCEHNTGEHTLQWTCILSKCIFIFFERTFIFFTAHSIQMQARSLCFFLTYLTFSKNRSLLLAEQEVGPNSFITDLEVVTNVYDVA